MANVRLNVLENFPSVDVRTLATTLGNTIFFIHGVYFPGSISFNTAAFIASIGTGSHNRNFSFYLYSLNGATLSLANSASANVSATASKLSWFTMATSATQDITPGTWYFAMSSNTSNATASTNTNISVFVNSAFTSGATVPYGGKFMRGWATNGFASTYATSDLQREGNNTVTQFMSHPYIVIAA